MANDKISNMTAAAVAALTGTGAAVEVSTGLGGVPATKQGLLRDLRTAMFAGGTGYTASDPLVCGTLSASGSAGFGGVGAQSFAVGYFRNDALATATQFDIIADSTFTSAATTSGIGIAVTVKTAAAAFTMSAAHGIYINDATKGAGSTITTQYGLTIADQTKGTSNYAIFTGAGVVCFGDTTQMVGNVIIGTAAAPSHNLQVAATAGGDRDIFLAGIYATATCFRVQYVNATGKTLITVGTLPTSSAGLPTGTLWSNSGVLTVA